MKNPRIRLITIDDEVADRLEEGREEFEQPFKARLGPAERLVREVVGQTLRMHNGKPEPAPWGGYLTVDEASGQIIGTCAFKSAPGRRGDVEISYYTFPDYERKGFATEMARELIRIAFASGDVQRVIAHTLPNTNASTRILEKLGMRFLGPKQDPEDGLIWRWELELAAWKRGR